MTTTSWTQTDITALEAAIKGGVLRVRYADREVQYQSISEMLKLLDVMRGTVAGSTGSTVSRTTYGRTTKGGSGYAE